MAEIKNLRGMSTADMNRELTNGAKFVVFQYCISIIVMTFKRNSNIYFIKSGESSIGHSIGYTFLTFFLGWWGFPWGPIYSIGSLYTNLSGGKDITQEVLQSINTSTTNN